MATNIKAISTGKTVIDLGTAQSFAVSTSYSRYANLTVDNFICEQAANLNEGLRWDTPHFGQYSFTSAVYKSYVASTGVLTAYSRLYGSYNVNNVAADSVDLKANVHVYLIA